MAENTPGPKQLDSDNGSSNFGGNFSRFGKGQPLGGQQPGEGFHALDPNPIEKPSVGGANPPWPASEGKGD